MRYAAINGDKCFCRSDMTLTETPEDNTICDRQCSENRNQACGSTQDSFIFTVYDSEQLRLSFFLFFLSDFLYFCHFPTLLFSENICV